jgi:hypothetical protein
MRIERKNSEIQITLSDSVDITGVQRLLDFLKFKELVSKSTANEDEINNLAEESKAEWWSKNKDRYIK